MVWLRKGMISSVPVVEAPDVAAGGAGLVCAPPAITATIKTTEMAKRGFRILRVAGLFTMNTFEIVREAQCPQHAIQILPMGAGEHFND
jgi:hypothetical protein